VTPATAELLAELQAAPATVKPVDRPRAEHTARLAYLMVREACRRGLPAPQEWDLLTYDAIALIWPRLTVTVRGRRHTDRDVAPAVDELARLLPRQVAA
jgi:hypothetical protein